MGRSDIGRYAVVPLWVARKASPAALKAYVVLGTYANDLNECWPSIATLAEDADCHQNTMRSAMKELRDLGAIRVDKRSRGDGGQTSNLYTLIHVEPTGDPPLQNPGGGPLQSTEPPPSQNLVGAIELTPKEQENQGELPLDETWRETSHPLCALVYDTIASIPRFAPRLVTDRHQVRHIQELVTEYLDLAPSVSVLTSKLTDFKTYWTSDRTRKQRVDGVATLRNYLTRFVATWAVTISKQGGRTARKDVMTKEGNVQGGTGVKDDAALLAEVKARREGRRNGK